MSIRAATRIPHLRYANAFEFHIYHFIIHVHLYTDFRLLTAKPFEFFRDFQTERGLLQEGQIMPSGKALLPPALNTPVDCQIDPNTAHVPCFKAGDHRVNEQLGTHLILVFPSLPPVYMFAILYNLDSKHGAYFQKEGLSDRLTH